MQYWNNTLVSGSRDRTVCVWDRAQGICTHILEGHTSTVRGPVIAEVNLRTGILELEVPLVVSASRDATMRVWRLPVAGTEHRSRQPFLRHVFTGYDNAVRSIAGHGNTIVSGSYDSTVRVWDVESGTALHVYRGHKDKVYSIAYSHELERAASGSMDLSVKMWCTRSSEQLYHLEGHTSMVGIIALSTQYLVTGSADATLRIWSPTTGQRLATLTGHTAAVTCFHHDPILHRIISGAYGGVKHWVLKSDAGAVHGRFVRDFAKGVPEL
ncbi:WD40-repeat-containing domain protein [Powellomyces hirtus]|nr:WD40-repeat-containing domain protein [Powellomyces hirtus]